jgi:hypothetical protein
MQTRHTQGQWEPQLQLSILLCFRTITNKIDTSHCNINVLPTWKKEHVGRGLQKLNLNLIVTNKNMHSPIYWQHGLQKTFLTCLWYLLTFNGTSSSHPLRTRWGCPIKRTCFVEKKNAVPQWSFKLSSVLAPAQNFKLKRPYLKG